MTERAEEAWREFAAAVAEISIVPAEEIRRDSLLVDDLGLDSLALAELAMLAETEFGSDNLLEDLEGLDVPRLTAGLVFDSYLATAPRRV